MDQPTDLTDLSDDELSRRCQALRLQATRGNQAALREALALEAEAERRFRAATTLSAPLEAMSIGRRPWWRFW
ncbi:hypothetical protein [Variovorax sp. J31P207]|uniref:hypothetical protein n=1 Tax=Variovorax sp. J31P207 TaxID=3053510 RepID=UPI002575AEC5|nr:hypothetical protein [Variovorax sp. J31P207]MDM0072732.1 hypothetical protein [Variovorax sp. J31P207]